MSENFQIAMTRYLQRLEVNERDSKFALVMDPNIFSIHRAIKAVSGIEAIIETPKQTALPAYTFWVLTKDLPPFEAGKVIEALRRIGNVRALPTITASGFWGLTDLQGGEEK